jgi:hypothetical protein
MSSRDAQECDLHADNLGGYGTHFLVALWLRVYTALKLNPWSLSTATAGRWATQRSFLGPGNMHMNPENQLQCPSIYWPLTLFLVLTACGPLDSERPTTATAQATNQAVAATSTLVFPAQEPPLVFFTSEPGGFQVWLPASGSIQEYTVRKTLFNVPIECANVFFGLNSAYAGVEYCDLIPESIASLSRDDILDQAQHEIMHDMHVKIESQQRVVMQETYPALALSGQVDMRGTGYDGTFKARVILVEKRIYLVLMSVYYENWCNCLHQMDQVVDSLYIEPGLSIPFEPTP